MGILADARSSTRTAVECPPLERVSDATLAKSFAGQHEILHIISTHIAYASRRRRRGHLSAQICIRLRRTHNNTAAALL